MISGLNNILKKEQILTMEPMSAHTTFRIGGPAQYFVMPGDEKELMAVVRLCQESKTPWFILGNGSNILVGDKGIDGVVISVGKNMSHISIDEETVNAQAGARLMKAAVEAGKKGLTGLEFAGGIPGTIGGSMVMNAGAYGGEMKQVVEKVTVLTKAGEIRELSNQEMKFGYRTSVVESQDYIVLEVRMLLKPGNKNDIMEKMEKLKKQRTAKQPLEYPSAGSTFKRPEGYYAGKLIMEAGLAGCQIGGAKVSEKHCGFVINTGGALAADVLALTEYVKEQVYKKTGVRLELEIKKVGDF